MKHRHLAMSFTWRRSIWSLNASKWSHGSVFPLKLDIWGILSPKWRSSSLISWVKGEWLWSHTFSAQTARSSMQAHNSSNSANTGRVCRGWFFPLVEVDEGDSLLLWRSLSRRSCPWSLSTSPADLPTLLKMLPKVVGGYAFSSKVNVVRVLESVIPVNSLLAPRSVSTRCLPWPGVTLLLAPPIVSSQTRR